MPKLGMEPLRRAALVEATIGEIGAAGTLDVTVGQIARRAGMSSALAHHYFGGKAQIFEAAMRRILRDYSAEVRSALQAAPRAEDRLFALIRANFAESCFERDVVNAWLVFYLQARNEAGAARLLQIYQRRLHSNLVHACRVHVADPQALAQVLAALIDGVYLRAALAGTDLGDEAADQVIRAARAIIGAET